MDVGAWYGERRYREKPGAQAIAEFARLRADLIAELRQLEERDSARIGVRADGSDITLLGLVERLSAHDRDHRWRIASILAGFASGQ